MLPPGNKNPVTSLSPSTFPRVCRPLSKLNTVNGINTHFGRICLGREPEKSKRRPSCLFYKILEIWIHMLCGLGLPALHRRIFTVSFFPTDASETNLSHQSQSDKEQHHVLAFFPLHTLSRHSFPRSLPHCISHKSLRLAFSINGNPISSLRSASLNGVEPFKFPSTSSVRPPAPSSSQHLAVTFLVVPAVPVHTPLILYLRQKDPRSCLQRVE